MRRTRTLTGIGWTGIVLQRLLQREVEVLIAANPSAEQLPVPDQHRSAPSLPNEL
jgi:hypothetical protein